MLTRPWSTTSRSSSPSVPRTRPTSRATRRSTATGWVSRRGPGRSPDPFRGLRRTLQSRFANAPAFANRSADAELAHHPQADDLLLHVVLERHALGGAHHLLLEAADEIGRASRRERVCPYVWIPGDAVHFNKKNTNNKHKRRIC